MSIWTIIILIAAAGALGGLTKSAIGEGFHLPKLDRANGVWTAGWVGHVAVGSVAAIVVWGIYGSAARMDLGMMSSTTQFSMPIAQLSFSLLVGMGGSEILKRLSEKKADDVSRANLTEALKALAPVPPPQKATPPPTQ